MLELIITIIVVSQYHIRIYIPTTLPNPAEVDDDQVG